MRGSRGTIGILTGGGDVPGLNPAIRAVTLRALREGYGVVGIRRGWAGLVDMVRDQSSIFPLGVSKRWSWPGTRNGRCGSSRWIPFLASSAQVNPRGARRASR